MAQAEAAVAAAGGPGTDIADPTQTANDTTLAGTTSASLFSLDHTDIDLTFDDHDVRPHDDPDRRGHHLRGGRLPRCRAALGRSA